MPGVHLEVPRPNSRLDRVSRNDSFKSERSDKKVSFNSDVGVKRIPRGQRNPSPLLVVPKGKKDEWANCAPVHHERPKLSSKELERQAEDLVKLLDQVDCYPGSQPMPHQPSRSLDRSNQKNNKLKEANSKINLNNANHSRKNNLVNGVGDNFKNSPRRLENSRTRNLINSPSKEDIRKDRTNSERPFIKRSLSAHPSAYDVNASDTDNTYEKYSATYKSVPDIPATIHYNNYTKPYERFNHLITHDNIGESKNFMSVDNIYNEKENRLRSKGKRNRNYNEYKSVDNLTDISIPGNRKLHEYKSVENLQSGYSSSTNDLEMSQNTNFKPRVGNMIRKFNSGVDDHRERIHTIMVEDDHSSPRRYREPDPQHFHNNNKPFSYTGAPLTSVEAVRRLSPSREISGSNDILYSKVNKDRSTRSTSREREQGFRNSNADYSAKIIITNNDYPEDDDAYETYQVGQDNFAKQIRELRYSSEALMDDYKDYNNANMNMSSVGVQTDKYPKPPQRGRKSQNSPPRYEYGNKEDYNNDHLSSASLVRRINHGFGRIDRSPSPPPRVVASHRKMPRNVVPLLSDTDESEFNYRGRRDPMARIRDQVQIRGNLRERSEEREEEEYFSRRPKSLEDLDSTGMQPLTVDDVGALPLEVGKRGRNSLVVSRQGHSNSNSTSRTTNERTYKSEYTNDRVHSAPPPRGRNASTERHPRDKSSSPSRAMSTLERMKKTLEKGKSSLDRSDPNLKEKKKKKIKIKFYYDPKVQENNREDPLNKFTEYRGTSSDERSSPANKYVDYASDPYDSYYRDSKDELRDDFHRTLLQDNYEKKDLSRTNYKNESTKVMNSTRAAKISSRDTSREKERDRSRGRDSSNERAFRPNRVDVRESRDNRRQALPNRPNYSYDSSLDRRERRASRENLRNSHEYLDNHHKREINTREETVTNKRIEHSTAGSKFYDEDSRLGHGKDNRFKVNNSYNEKDTVDRGTVEGSYSLSHKYRSLTRNTSPPRTEFNTTDKKAYTNEDEKQEKMMRQRKKFLGVLMGEGRDKGVSSSPHSKGESSTLPRTSPQKKETKTSNTLQRIEIKKNVVKMEKDEPAKVTIKEKKPKKKKKRQWPWSFLGLRGASRKPDKGEGLRSRPSSRASSKASSVRSSRISGKPSRPTLRAVKIRRDGYEGSRPYINRTRGADEDKHHRDTQIKNDQRKVNYIKEPTPIRSDNKPKSPLKTTKYSADSSPSSTATPVGARVNRNPSFKQRYFGDSDVETGRIRQAGVSSTGGGDYRSLPTRKKQPRDTRFNVGPRRGVGSRAMSPGNRGSAGSSLQSSESEADSHGGSHASRQSRASHVSTGSNRSVYLHATAVADIPVRRGSDETSERGLSRQSKKVSRSFSLLSPWKPRHYREKYEVEYDNREVRDGRSKSALPPRPPRKPLDQDNKNFGRSQTVYKDSKLTGWLKRKKNKDGKGI